MKRLLIFILFIALRQGIAQPFVLIPDPNFVIYLQSTIPGAMSGNSLNINSPLVTTSTQAIFVVLTNISNLSGIQYFSSLKYLNFSYTAITSLPVLPNSLTSLACTHSSLTSLPALPNSLQVLLCDSNKIICFPQFPTSLNSINLNSNPYSCLPNYVLPAMNNYTTTPLCVPGNPNNCAVVGIKELNQDDSSITVYPNPTSGQFNVETTDFKKQTLQLFDLNGGLIVIQDFHNKTSVDIANLLSGTYVLSIKSADKISNKKLVVVR